MGGLEALLADPDILKLRTALGSREGRGSEGEGVRKAAVALIFRSGAAGESSVSPELLFIKRAEYPGDPWSGQVAFPGGREEPGDLSLADTAARETREETGIDLMGDGTFIGTLDDLRPRINRLPDVIVRPYVVLLDRYEPLVLSNEVALAFWIPLEALKAADSWRETPVLARGVQINTRAFHHEGHIVWGMTERIVGQLLEILAS
jgi:8-oxo-dGTP pyrophosphatase MutT (NUDIX family)